MNELILTTYDWAPASPRGFVRDIRVRWALEVAGLPYRVESTPFRDRDTAHFSHQPFGQVPWLTDGDIWSLSTGSKGWPSFPLAMPMWPALRPAQPL